MDLARLEERPEGLSDFGQGNEKIYFKPITGLTMLEEGETYGRI